VYLLTCCIRRPEISASFLDQQRDFFNEKKVKVEAARRFLAVPDRKQEVGNGSQEDNFKEARLDVESELVEDMDSNQEKHVHPEELRLNVESESVEEMDGNEEKKVHPEESRLEVQNEVEERVEEEEMDDDVSRKDSFYDLKKDDGKGEAAPFLLSPATAGLLLFIAVIVGLVVTWYSQKLQRKRSGLHKKLDVAAPFVPVGTELRYGWEEDEW
jgi:hypothetical protein